MRRVKLIDMKDMSKKIRDVIEKTFPGGFTFRDEANALTAWAFRNGLIEDLHAGTTSELLSDANLSRISNDEMKEIMINASKTLEELLRMREEKPDEYFAKIVKYNLDYCQGWKR